MLVRGNEAVDVAVVGAGPYGLAVSAHLRGAGLSIRTFGRPMGAWRDNMPKGMFLKSAFLATSISAPGRGLSLADYCDENHITEIDDFHPLPIDTFINYGLDFQRRLVKEVEEVKVDSIVPLSGGFRVSLDNGESFAARKVVAAAGHMYFAYTPDTLADLARGQSKPGLLTHAGDHDDFDRFAGKSVAIVGAGQSALESAVLLREAGAKVHLVVRGSSLEWIDPPSKDDGLLRSLVKPNTPFGPGWSHFFFTRAPELVTYLPANLRLLLAHGTYGPSGSWWLRGRFDGAIDVRLGTEVVVAREVNGKAVLNLRNRAGAASALIVDHVLAATGYKVDVGRLDFLDAGLRRGLRRVPGSGAPALSRSFESSVPGLYFVGLSSAATFGPLQRFVHGTDFAARTVARALAASASHTAAPVFAPAA
ncbi:NAD(P)-binding domain-containing protein [Mesorhizobium sp. ANAO-SY3R2]|uniref:NAD(P)-binding domain-containing protein n=1 Tax=Mesorhizobium sp. ANAO-SY3R2 TaxID=3166644 RepID=UPI00366DF4D9